MPSPAVAQAKDVKERCRTAYQGARAADLMMAPVYDRWWSETLMALEGQPAGMALRKNN
jgi:hypothetical protein